MHISSDLMTGIISSAEGTCLLYDTLPAMLSDIKNTNEVLQHFAKLKAEAEAEGKSNINIKVTVEIAQNKSSYHISENNGLIRIKKTSENKQPFSIKTFWKSIKQIYIDWKECRSIKQQVTLNSTTLRK